MPAIFFKNKMRGIVFNVHGFHAKAIALFKKKFQTDKNIFQLNHVFKLF